MSIVIIADDLSGAADCAIGFASAGRRTVVTLDVARSQAGIDAEVMAADTDTRRLTAAQAAQRTRDAWQTLRAPGRHLYKKIDSTLRGNWAAEVAALQELAGLAIVAPAFPATGRTLSRGRVYVHGAPLESTETWQLEGFDHPADVGAMLEAAGLVTASLDLESLRGDPDTLRRHIAALARRGVQALVVDAENNHDLVTLAQITAAMTEPLFWVGSGGLAREMVMLHSLFAAPPASVPPPAHAARPGVTLILVGSLSAVSERQCALLRERTGVAELIVPPGVLREGERNPDWAVWQTHIGEQLGASTDLLLRIGRDAAFNPTEGPHLSTRLAALVMPHFAHVGGLIATGGETARAMLSAAGIGALELLAEVEAGVAVARPAGMGMRGGPVIVTKAGAFGSDNALYAAYLHVREASADTAGADTAVLPGAG
jgi:D-threonate/D-erythronate kinase